jgi:hypothetical protein
MEENFGPKEILEKRFAFTEKDFDQINNENISLEKITHELSLFQSGVPKIFLERPALINNGILSLSESEIERFAILFEQEKENFIIEKFVPASGAASRMFHFLSLFLSEYNPEKESINAYINRKNDTSLLTFIIGMDKFPFFKEIDARLNEKYPDFTSWTRDKKNHGFIKLLLDSAAFDFANKPKAVLPFHNYSGQIVTAIEEHLKEAIYYSTSKNTARLHFTISGEHETDFIQIIDNIKPKIEKTYNKTIQITFSEQHHSTNTIAVNEQNIPLRNHDGALVFRQAGHGALIKNLNNRDADIIFIKNIDNVSHNNIEIVTLHKKMLAGYLIALQQKIFKYLLLLDKETIEKNEVKEIKEFINDQLNNPITAEFSDYKKESKRKYLKTILDRPIRVCGIVKNENEPGGGPFWVRDNEGHISLQIVESSQINIDNKQQFEIFQNATHFNPVDIVCSIKNYKGEIFNLDHFIDPNSGFIVEKSKNGLQVKGYELPGLWNGAMAKWITIFIEVPIETFNPVKTVNDFLKPNHQPK